MSHAVVLLQPGAADWEMGPVLPALREYFGLQVRTASPDGRIVTTMGGLMVDVDTGYDTADIAGAEVVLLIGSEAWTGFFDQPLFDRLKARAEAGRPLGAICAGTLALARAGVLDARPHTSNALGFLKQNAPAYAGEALYRDAAHAVSDGLVVTAPGSAPASFAVAVAQAVRPEKRAEVVGYWNMARGEFEALGTELEPIWKG